MKTITQEELNKVFKLHAKWLNCQKDGVCADLSDTNLSGKDLTGANFYNANLARANLAGANLINTNFTDADLIDANFTGANLINTNFTDANLIGANFYNADLIGANFYNADLIGANFTGANLTGANFYNANLARANLAGANLINTNFTDANLARANFTGANLINTNFTDANLTNAILPDFQICPEGGIFVGYKKVQDDVILTLEIQGLRTSSLVGRKCRASKVKVLKAEKDGVEISGTFASYRKEDFTYSVGQIIEEPNYNPDVRMECVQGIHFFMTKKEAIAYRLTS